MWKAIAAVIKAMGERHIVPLVIAVAVAIAVIIYTPNDNWMIDKVGRLLFGIFVASITFILVVLIRKCFSCVRTHFANERYKKSLIEQNESDREQYLRELWNRIDGFSVEERNAIRKLVDTKNQPIKKSIEHTYSCDSFWDSELVNSTTVIDEKGKRIEMVKLNDSIYSFLKYSQEKYHRISDFD